YLPHTTSKITSEEHLLALNTFGFRGEALNSLTSVSNVQISSRTITQDMGTQINLEYGFNTATGAYGMPVGTQIHVKELFHNLPARKKFLKTPATEFRYILSTLEGLALANLNVGFSLINNGNTVFNLPSAQNLEDRVVDLLGKSLLNNFVPLKMSEGYINLAGYVARPQYSGYSDRNQYLFVNKRFVSNKDVAKAIKRAYGNLLPPAAKPGFLLFIDIPKEFVDVNVHPRKSEVAFVRESFSNDILHRATRHALQKEDLTYIKQGFDLLRSEVANIDTSLKTKSYTDEILQAHDLYLVKEIEDGLLLVDQHAAHERILFDKFVNQIKTGALDNIELNPFVLLDLGLAEKELLLEHLQLFENLGFSFVIEDELKVTHSPQHLADRNIKMIISGVLDDLYSELGVAASNFEGIESAGFLDETSLRALSYMACRCAIKGGDKLDSTQKTALIQDLMTSDSTYTCPHGRPARVILTTAYLNTLFSR
ncbi:MAG: hypothetical protein KDH96_11745, partial [Candidatus Riesia sp.]|nr:hypothetical protein [Candidatus Riesia sp.]